MNRHSPTRRLFCKLSATTLFSFIVGCLEKAIKPVSKKRLTAVSRTPAPSPPQHGRTSPSNQSNNLCRTTSRDITGPFWRDGVPIRNHFDLFGHKGQKLSLSGYVRDSRCHPIPDAVIEMWHAHPTTISADALTRKDSVDYDMKSPAFRYYGQFATNGLGHYSMTTQKPGWYLNGDSFRPSHIHVKIYVDGIERLTTQLYFKGDPFIPKDPWASAASERIIELKPTKRGELTAHFDFNLVRSV